MDINPVSQTPTHGQNPGKNLDVQDLVLCFGSLNLEKDGNSEVEEATSQSNNASSPAVSTFHTVEEDAADSKNTKKIKNQSALAQEISEKTQWLPENSVSDHANIWGYRFFVTEAREGFGSNAQESIRDSKDSNVDLCKQENFDAGSSSKQPRMESFCCYPSMLNCITELENNPVFYEEPSFRPSALYNYENYQLSEITNNRLYSGAEYATMNHDLTSSCQWNQQEIDTFPGGKNRSEFVFVQEILETGDRKQIDMLLFVFQGSYISLMTDKHMFILFQKLLDACRVEQLSLIVEDVLLWSPLFIDAAFCRQGATSIIRLIKKLKKSIHAFSVTKVLSNRFLAIMTHDAARVVIQQCFIYFGNQPNKILYEKAIYHCQELATHKVGCRALNEIINTIGGEQRSRLLNHIADSSAYLSNDPYGNYVVQNVLSLKNRDVSDRIVLNLRGQFTQLARNSGGSHVVEKCMESSHFGIVTVVEEILGIPKEAFRLAQDNIGNYVIQKALNKTKERGLDDLYDSLVKSLQPYCEALKQTTGGKNVLNLLRDDGQLKWQTSICGKDCTMPMRRWILSAKRSMV